MKIEIIVPNDLVETGGLSNFERRLGSWITAYLFNYIGTDDFKERANIRRIRLLSAQKSFAERAQLSSVHKAALSASKEDSLLLGGEVPVLVDIEPRLVKQMRKISYALGLSFPAGVIDDALDFLSRNPDINPDIYLD